MPLRKWRSLPERELYDRMAEVEGHDSQINGVGGYFYRLHMGEIL